MAMDSIGQGGSKATAAPKPCKGIAAHSNTKSHLLIIRMGEIMPRLVSFESSLVPVLSAVTEKVAHDTIDRQIKA